VSKPPLTLRLPDRDVARFFTAVSKGIEKEHRDLQRNMSATAKGPEALYARKYPKGLYWKIREEAVGYIAFRAAIPALAPRYEIAGEDPYGEGRKCCDLAIYPTGNSTRVAGIEIKWWGPPEPVRKDIARLRKLPPGCRRFLLLLGSRGEDKASATEEFPFEIKELGPGLRLVDTRLFPSGWIDKSKIHGEARAFQTYYVVFVEVLPSSSPHLARQRS
jgi:hypothetical protein